MDSKPWILYFIDIPHNLIDKDVDNSLEILAHWLISNEESADNVFYVSNMLLNSSLETIYMVFFSSLFAFIFGLPLGVILSITKKHSLLPMPLFNKILGIIVNILRSLPYIILIIVIWPLSKILTGTSIGPDAAIVSLSISAIPFVARLFEGVLDEVDKGLIEATLSMGASKLRTILMMIAESMPSLINAMTISVISIIGYSAMAAALGAGGLGAMALIEGFQNAQMDILYSSVIAIIIMVQIVQSSGDYLSNMLRRHEYGIFTPLVRVVRGR